MAIEYKYYDVTLVNKKDGCKIRYECVKHVIYDAIHMCVELYIDDGLMNVYNLEKWWIFSEPKIIVRY